MGSRMGQKRKSSMAGGAHGLWVVPLFSCLQHEMIWQSMSHEGPGGTRFFNTEKTRPET